MTKWIVLKIIKGAGFITVVGGILGFIVMTLWNMLLPELFQLPAITFWQALGLLILTNILFRGFGHRCGHGGGHHGYWKRRFEEKLAAMTPEEREKFKAEWKNRCGWRPGETPSKTE